MNAQEIESLPPGKTLWDDKVTGLHVRATELGKKGFFFFYRTRAGKQRRPKIGSWPLNSLAEVRSRAQALSAQAALGADPKGCWDVAKAELTLAELFDKTMKEHWDNPRMRDSGWTLEVKRTFARSIRPAFGAKKLSEITPPKIRTWLATFADRPMEGNRAHRVLSRMFSYAEECEIRLQNTNPCALVKQFPERSRKRYATVEEVARIARILERDAEEYPHAVAFIYLLIFSGARPRFIERAQRKNLSTVNYNGEVIGVLKFDGKSTGKTGEEETVIIPGQAMNVIARIPCPRDGTILGIKTPHAYWKRVKTEAGCEDLWIRDWRRTFATIALSNGTGMDVIAGLLNHQSTQTTKIYGKLFDGAKFDAANNVAASIEKLMGGLQLPVGAGA